MDPLSVTASAITIATTIAQLIRGIENLKILQRAPKQVYDVVDELADFQVVLDSISHFHRQSAQNIELGKILKKSEKTLAELDKTIKDGLWADLSSASKVKSHKARLAWLRHEKDIGITRMRLREQRSSLVACLSAGSSTTAKRVELMVTDVKLLMDRSTQEQQAFEQLLIQRLDEQSANLAKISQESVSKAQLQSAIDHFFRSQPRLNSLLSSGQGSSSSQPVTVICVEAVRIGSFESYCPCSCHPKKRLKSPQLLDRLLGGLFMAYSGRPTSLFDCEYCKCRAKKPRAVHIRYYFPWWLFARQIGFVLAMNSCDGPSFGMEFPRTISNVAPLIQYTKTGNLRGIQRLFEDGYASTKDITSDFGSPALLFAFSYDKPNVARFLIEQGADPLVENKLQATAADVAWTRILGDFIEADLQNQYLEILGSHARKVMLARKRFTKIHKIVLGLTCGSLEDELARSRTLINRADSGGFTALGWAAARGDLSTTETLLLHGAKIYLPGIAQSDALNCAMASRSPSCITPLLRAGADANAQSEFGETALHIAAMRHDEPERYMAPLLEYGAYIDMQDKMGFTALCYAVQFKRVDTVRFLGVNGAELDLPNNAGLNALGLAMTENDCQIVEDLLVLGANASHIFPMGQNILHLAAMYGTNDMFDVLEKAELELDSYIRDKNGQICIEILRARRKSEAGVSVPSVERMQLLCLQIKNRWTHRATESPNDSDDSKRLTLLVRVTRRSSHWLFRLVLRIVATPWPWIIVFLSLEILRREKQQLTGID